MTSGGLSVNKGIHFLMIKNRLWVVALTILTAVLGYVIIPGLALGGMKLVMLNGNSDYTKAEIIDRLRLNALDYFGFCGPISLFVIALACVIAIQGFAYLYKQRSVDFFESQPLTHVRRFFIHYLNGIIIVATVYAAAMLLGMFTMLSVGAFTVKLATIMLIEYIRLMLLFVSEYSLFVMAAVMSGNVFMAFLLGGFLNSIELIIRLLLLALKEVYLTTATYRDSYTGGDFISSDRLTPLSHYFGGVGMKFGDADFMIRMVSQVFWLVLLTVIFTAISVFVFSKRPRENTGRGLCFASVESAIKIIIAIAVGISAGMIVDEAIESFWSMSLFAFLVIVIAVGLTCLVGEVILSLSIAGVTRRIWQIPLCIAVSVVILLSYKFDIAGYDRYVPSPDEVEYAGIYLDEAQNSTYIVLQNNSDALNSGYEGSWYTKHTENIGDYLSENMHLDPDIVCRIAKPSMKNARDRAKDGSHGYLDGQYSIGWSAEVYYKLKSGRMVWRQIYIPYDIDGQLLDELLGSENYHKEYFGLDNMLSVLKELESSEKCSISIDYSGASLAGDDKRVSADTIGGFVSAYNNDLKKYDYSYIEDHEAIGTVTISVTSQDGTSGGEESFTVFEGFTASIDYLDKIGIYSDSDASKVKAVKVESESWNYDDNGDDIYTSTEHVYTDGEQIKQIIAVSDMSVFYDWQRAYNYNESDVTLGIEVYVGDADNSVILNDDNGEDWNVDYEDVLYYNLYEDKIPDFIREDFGIKD